VDSRDPLTPFFGKTRGAQRKRRMASRAASIKLEANGQLEAAVMKVGVMTKSVEKELKGK
jgi:hypothetical protein